MDLRRALVDIALLYIPRKWHFLQFFQTVHCGILPKAPQLGFHDMGPDLLGPIDFLRPIFQDFIFDFVEFLLLNLLLRSHSQLFPHQPQLNLRWLIARAHFLNKPLKSQLFLKNL